MLTHRTQVAISELKLIRTIERIEKLKHEGRWAFRQTKKQRGVGGLMKTHWDYLLDEMVGFTLKARA
jgi:chromatin modification-related protein VID21